jgi:hypothetical protein
VGRTPTSRVPTAWKGVAAGQMLGGDALPSPLFGVLGATFANRVANFKHGSLLHHLEPPECSELAGDCSATTEFVPPSRKSGCGVNDSGGSFRSNLSTSEAL